LNAKPWSFLADESCDLSVIRVLRQVDYSVKAIAEISPSQDVKYTRLIHENGFAESLLHNEAVQKAY
jgi:hypothetical protein